MTPRQSIIKNHALALTLFLVSSWLLPVSLALATSNASNSQTGKPDLATGSTANGTQGDQGFQGNPISIYNGNKYEFAADINLPSPHRQGFSFSRSYNSQTAYAGTIGHGWRHSFGATLTPNEMINGVANIHIVDQTGRGHYFTNISGSRWDGGDMEYSYVIAENGGYTWHEQGNTTSFFTSQGRLEWLDDPLGNRQSLAYDTNGRLATVTDQASARTLTFAYRPDGLLTTISGPASAAVSDGILVRYDYDVQGNLTSVIYADDSGFRYEYADANDPHNLTAKRDQANHLLSTWAYDNLDRAYQNITRDGRGITINYVDERHVEVTDAYGVTRTFTFTFHKGQKMIGSISGPGSCSSCADSGQPVRYGYDALGRTIEEEYANDTINRFSLFNSHGQTQRVIYAAGSPAETTVDYGYHPSTGAKIAQAESSVLSPGNDKKIFWDYDNPNATGNTDVPNEAPTSLLYRIIERGYTHNSANSVVSYEKITKFTYNAKGQVLAVDGPLTDTSDTTSFSYDTSGNLLDITPPLIGATSLGNYDAAGNPTLLTDINGQATTVTYDGRNRVVSRSSNGITVSLTYNQAGDLSTQTSGANATTTYSYNQTSGLLQRITDPLQQYLAYDHDSQGNVTGIAAFTPENVRRSYQGYNYQSPDSPGKLWKVINFDGSATVMTYDAMGNRTSLEDAAHHSTLFSFDAMNRLQQITQPGAAVTHFSYDKQNNQTSVIDAENHTTSYTFDDMGKPLTETSPDSGSTRHRYDVNGNHIGTTDANGVSITYGFDLLNRLTSISFPDASQNITYTYDQGANGKGRLTAISDPSGSSSLEYDNHGRLVKETKTISGKGFITSYAYNNDHQLTEITYPGGRVIRYSRNAGGQISKVESVTGATSTLAANLSYRPFGPLATMTLGNGLTETRDYDEALRLTAKAIGSVAGRTYGYNPDGTVSTITDNKDASVNQSFSYDGQERLTGAIGKYGTLAYSYDKTGNRLSETKAGQSETYSYLTGTNKLQTVTGQTAIAYSFDTNGNTTAIGNQTFTYNQNNRLIEAKEAGNVKGQYAYNGLGQRVQKIAGGKTTLFIYDKDGNLIVEADETGKVLTEYVYLDGQKLSKFAVNPGEDNLRFPGQYFDAETGLHYNWHRYYDPKTGRYLTPDPIGLAGGINLYAYVQNNPVNRIDPDGQMATVIGGAIGGGIAGGVAGGVSGVLSSRLSGDSWGTALQNGLAGAGIGAVAGGIAGAALGAGIPGGLGLAADLGWGLDLGLLTGQHAALTSNLGAMAGALTGIFIDPPNAYGDHGCK